MIIFKTSFVRNLLSVWVLDHSPVPKLQKSEESESFEKVVFNRIYCILGILGFRHYSICFFCFDERYILTRTGILRENSHVLCHASEKKMEEQVEELCCKRPLLMKRKEV
ncbi:uncharacterized protein LOC118489150 [Helianthus annuus]|uniref:uncharacterized protein LOC118489150 n=1 Tax=Helianthus annuus TaxID=4232 RepID=UPI001652E4B8|nr:uncharacterized protein LOC118489150 [Helianthus annuus]